jgi:heptosyltransferase-2
MTTAVGASPRGRVSGPVVGRSGTGPLRVVVRLPNPAGDVVLATPALRALRAAWSSDVVRITWSGRPAALDLLDGLPDRDEVHRIEGRLDRGGLAWLRLGSSWGKAGANVVIVMPGSISSALAARASLAEQRIGYAGRGRRVLLTHALPVPRDGRRPRPRPMREHYLDLVRVLGFEEDGDPPRLATTPDGDRAAAARLAAAGLARGGYVVVSPGAAFGPSKVCPPRIVADAVARVRKETGLVPLVMGGPGEEALVEETARGLGFPVATTGRDVARWPEAKSLLAGAALLVTPDAGPRHVAAALGTPVVALLGPTHPAWGSGDEALVTAMRREEVPCLACHLRECPVPGHPCMERVDPAELAAACLARLSARRGGYDPPT